MNRWTTPILFCLGVLWPGASACGSCASEGFDNIQRDRARVQMAVLKQSVLAYRERLGRAPPDLETLEREIAPDGAPTLRLDPWGRPFVYEHDPERDRVRIATRGEDGVLGNADDLELRFELPPTPPQR